MKYPYFPIWFIIYCLVTWETSSHISGVDGATLSDKDNDNEGESGNGSGNEGDVPDLDEYNGVGDNEATDTLQFQERPPPIAIVKYKAKAKPKKPQRQTLEGTTPAPRTAIIAELVGLSTLKGFLLLAFPLLIPILIIALFIFFLPLPLLSTPIAAIGRRFSENQQIDVILEEILQSTNCIERLSCEIGRTIKTPQVRTIIDQSFSELGSQLEGKWKGSLRGYILGSTNRLASTNICTKFKCKIGKNPL